MSNLIEQIRKARQTRLMVNGRVLVICRPTDLEMVEYGGRMTQRVILEQFVVDWEGFQEKDFVKGGTDEEVPFHSDLFMEYAEDHPEIWPEVSAAVVESYSAHKKATEESLKN